MLFRAGENFMKLFSSHRFLLLTVLTLFGFAAQAEVNAEIKQLQREWAQIKYELDKPNQEAALEQLAGKAGKVREGQPENADAYLWEGIILSTYAGAIASLRALDTVNRSRAALEQSIEIDPNANNGAAYTFLGTLYYLVPEWPIAFGDYEQAQVYLQKGLALNPDGIDANYFYADFLRKQRKYEQAETVFNKALVAPPRPGRELADSGRRKEAAERLKEVKAKIEKRKKKRIKQPIKQMDIMFSG